MKLFLVMQLKIATDGKSISKTKPFKYFAFETLLNF